MNPESHSSSSSFCCRLSSSVEVIFKGVGMSDKCKKNEGMWLCINKKYIFALQKKM
jgi:hypothetical protein